MSIKLKVISGLVLLQIIILIIFSVAASKHKLTANQLARSYPQSTPVPTTAIPPITPTSTPVPLTFAQLNTLYGPCVHVPTLMYHHVQDLALAKTQGRLGLTTGPQNLASQLTYFKQHGYNTVKISDLINFFDHAAPLPSKPILLTFDDGYDDFYTNAYPLLRENNYSAVMFLPTGLLNNPGYLTWSDISAMSGTGLVYFANHTWSHHQLKTTANIVHSEISTAATQLSDHGLDASKVFAYPYGTVSATAQTELAKDGFQLAFTTRPGSTLCSKQRLNLPRLRIGNLSPSALSL